MSYNVSHILNLGQIKTVLQTISSELSKKYVKPSGGIPASDLAAGVIPTIDSTPTTGSTNAVSSGGTKTYVDSHYVTAGQKSGTTLGSSATAEGISTTSSGIASHAEGSQTVASASCAHAEGVSTVASGYESHAEGDRTTASGADSHAEGSQTIASGGRSHAEGNHTIAQRLSQHVFGEYNIADTTGASVGDRGSYVEIVGKGTSDSARSNARTLDWSGNEVLAGKLTVGAAPTANMDVATKQYADTKAGKSLTFQVTLTTAGWSSNAQTITNSNFITSGYTYIVSPAPANFSDYASAQIYADDVTVASNMTFHCSNTPSSALVVNITRMEST